MRRAALVLLALALVAAGVAAMPVAASPYDDFTAVYNDWKPDGDVAACRFTRQRLVSARAFADGSTDFYAYNPGFRDEVTAEIGRWDSGGCKGVSTTPKAQKGSALAPMRFARIKPKGGAPKEYVTLRNGGKKTLNLKGASIRDRSGHRLKLRRKLRIKPGRSLRVTTGCRKGRKKAVLKKARFFACRRSQLWNDKGDVVRLVDKKGVVAAQRGFGKYRGVRRF